MKKRFLQIRMMAKAVMIGLLFGVVGIIKGYAVTIGNLTYSLDSQSLTATVTGHKNGTAATGSLVIPASVTYEGMSYAVKTIIAVR